MYNEVPLSEAYMNFLLQFQDKANMALLRADIIRIRGFRKEHTWLQILSTHENTENLTGSSLILFCSSTLFFCVTFFLVL